MDNRIFPNGSAHLQVRQPCAPIPLAVVTGTGTKHSACLSLWITTWLCQNYPQSYAPALVRHEFVPKIGCSACCIGAISYSIDSKHELQEPCGKCRSTSTSAKRCPKNGGPHPGLVHPPFLGQPTRTRVRRGMVFRRVLVILL